MVENIEAAKTGADHSRSSENDIVNLLAIMKLAATESTSSPACVQADTKPRAADPNADLPKLDIVSLPKPVMKPGQPSSPGAETVRTPFIPKLPEAAPSDSQPHKPTSNDRVKHEDKVKADDKIYVDKKTVKEYSGSFENLVKSGVTNEETLIAFKGSCAALNPVDKKQLEMILNAAAKNENVNMPLVVQHLEEVLKNSNCKVIADSLKPDKGGFVVRHEGSGMMLSLRYEAGEKVEVR
jgi:hypothetical protein